MTWDEIFERLGLTWCAECPQFYAYHEHGMLIDTVMHWRKRRVYRAGIYKLLRRIAGSQDLTRGLPFWRQTYLLNQEILVLAKRVGLRLPRTAFDLDRARLRFALSEYRLADRRRMTPSEQKDFRAAIRWAARS